jgi:hypothetical protein
MGFNRQRCFHKVEWYNVFTQTWLKLWVKGIVIHDAKNMAIHRPVEVRENAGE